jgi:hypothetical protein
MKKLQQFHGNLELPQNGNLIQARTKEDLLTILGFRSSAKAHAGQSDKVERISDVSKTECERPRSGSSDRI